MKYEVISQLIQNECYVENFNDYKYVAAFDNDEVIFPNRAGFPTMDAMRDYIVNMEPQPEANSSPIIGSRHSMINSEAVFNDFKCNRLESMPGNGSSFEKYFDELSTKLKFTKPTAYYFSQSYFISLNMTEQIFRNMELAFNQINSTIQQSSLKLSFSVTDWNRQEPHSFTFTIANENELHYAANLLKIYKTVLLPYLAKNDRLLNENIQYFDRLFSIVGRINGYAIGKTLHDTRLTAGFSIHYMEV
jgi:hypothetical protein